MYFLFFKVKRQLIEWGQDFMNDLGNLYEENMKDSKLNYIKWAKREKINVCHRRQERRQVRGKEETRGIGGKICALVKDIVH